jgi:O-antigen/teichoic acid export membrane protein
MNESIKSVSLYLLQIFISGVLMLLMMPIISKYLSPNDLGIFVLAQVYTSVAVGIANLGMLVGYERNFFVVEKSVNDSARLISSAVIFVSINLLALFFLVYLFQSEISRLIFATEIHSNLLVMVLFGTAASSISQFYLIYLKNSGMVRKYVKHMIVNSVINFMIALLLITQSDFGAMSLAYAWIFSNSILLISLLITLRRRLFASLDMDMLKDMLKISLPLTPRVFFGFINTQLDKILLGYIGSTSLVGVYHMGQTFAMTIFQFMTGLGRVFQPEVYRKLFANKHISNPQEVNNYILPFFYFSILMALIVVLFSKEFVLMFLSSEYESAGPIIIILSVYYASLFFGKITGPQLIYAKKTHITTLLMFIGIAINVGLNIPFIMHWGAIGAAWATTISGAILTVITYFVAQKYIKVIWEWKSVFAIYSFFLIAVIFSIIDYGTSQNLYISLLIKSLIIFSYIFIGFVLNLVSLEKIKKLIVLSAKSNNL